jgi:hypothetical protein
MARHYRLGDECCYRIGSFGKDQRLERVGHAGGEFLLALALLVTAVVARRTTARPHPPPLSS